MLKKSHLFDPRQDKSSLKQFSTRLKQRLELQRQQGITKHQYVYVDEAGFWLGRHKPHFYGKRGQQYAQPSYLENQSIKRNVIGSLINGKVQNLMIFEDTIDSAVFEAWFSQQLLPNLAHNATIIMDNARFHRKATLFEIIKRFNRDNKKRHTIWLQPPYSPEVNMIENLWAAMKKAWRKILPQLTQPLVAAFSSFLAGFEDTCFSEKRVKLI